MTSSLISSPPAFHSPLRTFCNEHTLALYLRSDETVDQAGTCGCSRGWTRCELSWGPSSQGSSRCKGWEFGVFSALLHRTAKPPATQPSAGVRHLPAPKDLLPHKGTWDLLIFYKKKYMFQTHSVENGGPAARRPAWMSMTRLLHGDCPTCVDCWRLEQNEKSGSPK